MLVARPRFRLFPSGTRIDSGGGSSTVRDESSSGRSRPCSVPPCLLGFASSPGSTRLFASCTPLSSCRIVPGPSRLPRCGSSGLTKPAPTSFFRPRLARCRALPSDAPSGGCTSGAATVVRDERLLATTTPSHLGRRNRSWYPTDPPRRTSEAFPCLTQSSVLFVFVYARLPYMSWRGSLRTRVPNHGRPRLRRCAQGAPSRRSIVHTANRT